MEFEWDDNKNLENIAKHGVDFKDAQRIFEGFTIDVPDDRFDYSEERTISIGMIENIVVLTVVHTERDEICRIISARPANRKERKRYEEEILKTFNA